MKYVYFFGAGKAEGHGEQRDLLGGKGAGLHEMTRIGLPVPAGFTITTQACNYFFEHAQKYPRGLEQVSPITSPASKKPPAKNWAIPATPSSSACVLARRVPCPA